MAKITKRNLDSARRAPVRKSSYEAPSLKKNKKRSVPKEYQTFNKAPRGRGGLVWFIFLLFIATFAGFVYWNQRSGDDVEESLKFSVTGPDKIISGDQVVFNLEYENLDIVTLQQLELNIRWPKGFYFDEASIEPSDSNATTWFFEDLPVGRSGNLEIKGQLVGQKDEDLATYFTLSYQPENFHSDFKAREEIATKITDNKIELAIDGVEKTLVSTEQEFRIAFRNLTDEDIEELYADVLYPDDWVEYVPEESDEEEVVEVTEGEEEPTGEFIREGQYYKFDLKPEEEKILTIKGSFPTDSASEQSLVVEVGNLSEDDFRRLARMDKELAVVSPRFDTNLEINGETGAQSVNWGDTLRYQLEITNNSGADINDLQVTALLDSSVLDWDSLETVGSQDDNMVVWTKDNDEELGTWPNEEKKTFTWQINISEEPQSERMVENIIKLSVQGLEGWEQVTSPVLLTVGESLSFNNGIYWDLGGRRVGSGLLPPQVGEETQYLAVWSLPEATGNFDSVTLEATLPPEVAFISETDVQEGILEFDEESRTLTWTLSEFDELLLPVTSSFIIQLIPTEDSRGQAVTLLNQTTVTAQGLEEVIVKSKAIKTSDVISNLDGPIGIVE